MISPVSIKDINSEPETTFPCRICYIILIDNFTEIGVGLAGFGVAFLFLGVLLLFDKGLLAIGNVIVSKLDFS